MTKIKEESVIVEQPLDFDLRKNNSDFIYRLSKLNQFEETFLDMAYKGSVRGVLNVMNGCFIHEDTITIGGGLFTRGEKKYGIRLTWQRESTETLGHSFFLEGQEIERFITLMEKVSLKYD